MSEDQSVQLKDLESLNRWLLEHNFSDVENQSRRRPPVFKPFLWKWQHLYEGITKTSELVPMETAERRRFGLANPGLDGDVSKTMYAGLQCVMPGEVARAHRHTPAAIRFVVKGAPGVVTVVNGEPFPMLEGDLITTPYWTWHDHRNESNQPAIWIDGLDVRLAILSRTLGEESPSREQPIERPVGYSARTLSHARPAWVESEQQPPPFRYSWEDTYATLMALKARETEGDPYDGILLNYRHPLTGGPTLPTLACGIQLLTGRQQTLSHRHMSSTVYHAFRGTGVTVVDGERLEWSQGDMFVVPAWSWHQHENRADQDAILFSMSDQPAWAALGVYQEEGSTSEDGN